MVRSALLLLVPVACTPSKAAPQARLHLQTSRAAPPTLSTVALSDFVYMGPGSMGRFVDYKQHPTLDGTLVATGDVGGVYLTTDDGASWTNVLRNLPTSGVWSIGVVVEGEGDAEITRLVVGTDSGLFYSNDVPSGGGIDPEDLTTWTEGAGLDHGDERPDQATLRALSQFNLNWRSMPVGALTVDPSDPEIVWAGITAFAQFNLAQDPSDPYSLQHFDRWKVYRSTDGGRTWAPALRFSEPIESFVFPGYDSDGSVFTILVDPEDSSRVWVASDRGLYASSNADTTEDDDGDGLADIRWSEQGNAARRETDDLGMSWTTMFPRCEDWAEGSTATSWCLPIVDNARVEFVLEPDTGWPSPGYEWTPNTRSLSIAEIDGVETLYVTVWDRGHANDEHEDCDPDTPADSFYDKELEHSRGGVYASTDGGESWRWLFTDTGAPGQAEGTEALTDDVRYRCDQETSERHSDADTSYFPDVEARPEGDTDFLIVSVQGARSGIWRYDPTDEDDPWLWLTNTGEDGYDERFEGARPLNISRGRKVDAARLLVDWESKVEGWPELWFALRGILHGVYDADAGWYVFDHLGSTYVGEIDGLPAWQGTGLDDAVFWDVLEVGDELYVGVSDGALQKAELVDGVWTYTAPATETWTSNWSTDANDFRKDETHAIARDETDGTVYAVNVATASDYLYSVLAFDGSAWTIVGGYGWHTDEAAAETIDAAHMNGLYTGSPLLRLDFNQLVWVPDEAGSALDLLAATSDGLWAYDAEAEAGAQWSRVCSDLTRGWSFAEIALDQDRVPGHAFAVGDGRRSGGVIDVDLATAGCSPIRTFRTVDAPTGEVWTNEDPIRSPSAVALAEDEAGVPRLVVAATNDGYPALFSGELDCAETCTVSEWTRAITLEGLYDDDDPREPILKRFDFTAIAVDPNQPSLLLASIAAKPGYDYYNPQWMIASEDGGQTASTIDFSTDDHELPFRGLYMLEFSEDGSQLYAGTRTSLYAMPVGW